MLHSIVTHPDGRVEPTEVGGWSAIKALLNEGYMRPVLFGNVVLYVDEHAEQKGLPVNAAATRAATKLALAVGQVAPLETFRGVGVFVGALVEGEELTEVNLPASAFVHFDRAVEAA